MLTTRSPLSKKNTNAITTQMDNISLVDKENTVRLNFGLKVNFILSRLSVSVTSTG